MLSRILIAVVLTMTLLPAQTQAPRFSLVEPGTPLQFPRDFGAHPDFRTEWWYATGWLQTPDGKPLGFQITFFRSATEHDPDNPSQFAPKQLIIGHAGLTDPTEGGLLHEQKIARTGFGLAWAKTDNTDVGLDKWHLVRDSQGRYHASIETPEFSFKLTLAPTQAPLLQGSEGFFRKGRQEQGASYYYSEPQLHVTGNVVYKGASLPVKGTGWLDHEWGSQMLDEDTTGWDWIGVNLADGGALMATHFRGKDGSQLWGQATLRNANGEIKRFKGDEVRFIPLRQWQSPATGARYPVEMQVVTGTMKWRLKPLQDAQEFDAHSSTGIIYWEGPIEILQENHAVGRGYLEMTGYVKPLKL